MDPDEHTQRAVDALVMIGSEEWELLGGKPLVEWLADLEGLPATKQAAARHALLEEMMARLASDGSVEQLRNLLGGLDGVQRSMIEKALLDGIAGLRSSLWP